jgi:protein-disulfide isomerase
MLLINNPYANASSVSQKNTGHGKIDKNESFFTNLEKMHFPDSVSLKEMIIGDAKASNTLIVYASFTCPYCRDFFHQVYPEFEKQYINTKKGKIYLRIYLDSLATLEGAALVRCFAGNSRDKISNLYHAIYIKLDEWMKSRDPGKFLRNEFKSLGYGSEKIDACLADEKISAGLMKEHQRAVREFQISLIPAFIINGKVHQGKLTFRELDAKLKGTSK